MLTTRVRRLAALIAALLVASLAPVVVSPTPAFAADCLSEKPTGSLITAVCDDVTPPETEVSGMSPVPVTAEHYINVDHVTFTFGGTASAGDSTPSFECQFLAQESPGTWTACTSPMTYDNLADTTSNAYTFRVRAIDKDDSAIDATAACGLFCTAASSDVADVDITPIAVDVRVDTEAPAGRVVAQLYDEENDEWPMVDSRNLPLRLLPESGGGTAPLTFSCKLNGSAVPCAPGVTTLTGLSPGDKTFVAVARDLAGNVDSNRKDDTIKFSVPRNLKAASGSGWKRVREGGYFAGDFLQSSRVGATVSTTGKNVRELRLIAPQGPGLGVVEVQIGQGIWRKVNLNAAKYERFHVYYIRDRFEPLVSGKITVRVKSLEKNQTARVDAILAH